MQILIIDSDKVYTDSFIKYFSSFGINVSAVADAQGALELIDIAKPELIILEPVLSNNNGIEFLYELRSYSDWQDIPVIILSRIDHVDMAISEKLKKEFNIVSTIYKSETSLSRLLEVVKRCMDRA